MDEINAQIEKDTEEILQVTLDRILSVEDTESDPPSAMSITDQELINFVIKTAARNEEGRLILPALWNEEVQHLLPNNYFISLNILKSILKKYIKTPEKLLQYDEVIKKQIRAGVVEEISDLKSLINNKKVSFIPHNAVFRQQHESTKCRIVYLSNTCDRREQGSLSHNQISLPGPTLNSQIHIALTLLRFNKYLLIFDLEKAFLQLCLRPEDTQKLHFLWYRDVPLGDMEVVAYRFTRVTFGLRFSPFLLMISLYLILLHNDKFSDQKSEKSDNHLRHMLYNLAYMDNLAFSSSVQDEITKVVPKIKAIFAEYKFNLQQFAVNVPSLQTALDTEYNVASENSTKLFGLMWNKSQDTIRVSNLYLNTEACTFRQVLQTIHANFDPLGLELPVLNRAKLFLHQLQMDTSLTWDIKLSPARLKEWTNIAKQLNNSIPTSIPRFMGNYTDLYDLYAFVDASSTMYGAVLYLFNIRTSSLHIMQAKNHLVKRERLNKSIPELELLALSFGVELLHKTRAELSECHIPVPIENMHLYSDSTIALQWLSGKSQLFTKVEKKGCLINNHLDKIVKSCANCPITFHHIAGEVNPADYVTRPFSRNLLVKGNFYTGPNLSNMMDSQGLTFTVPFPYAKKSLPTYLHTCTARTECGDALTIISKFSSFRMSCIVLHRMRQWIYEAKCKIKKKNSLLFPNFNQSGIPRYRESCCILIKLAQQQSFPDIFEYFRNALAHKPSLCTKLNLFSDRDGLIRVSGKLRKLKAEYSEKCPLLLEKNSPIAKAVIWDTHERLKHGGVYKVLSIVRKEFWIPSVYVLIKKVLKQCVFCNKLNGRTIKLNENDYRDFRVNPSQVPYRDLALDHMGPFTVRLGEKPSKIYILIITCLWSRAVNLIISFNLNNRSFLQALQTHVCEFGVPQFILSDNGSPIVSSIPTIQRFLSDSFTQNYLIEHNIKPLSFAPYPAGASFLGGLVESLVKQVKRVLYSSVGKNVLDFEQFAFLVKECNMLVNKRPIGFKPSLRNPNINTTDSGLLTPEILVKGYEIPSLVIAPHLHHDEVLPAEDSFWGRHGDLDTDSLFLSLEKLRNVKAKLRDLYFNEFVANLKDLSSKDPNKYKNRSQKSIKIGDLVAIKEKLIKPYFYPVGLITKIELNDMDEITAVSVRKSNRETIRRHISDIIFLQDGEVDSPSQEKELIPIVNNNLSERPHRKAAETCKYKLKSFYNQGYE